MSTLLDEQFWVSEQVHELGPIGIAVWSCIIQGRHASSVNLPGLYSISPEDVVRQLGGDLMGLALRREVENSFEVILAKAMAIYDPPSGQLRLPTVWKYAQTPNPNQISGWLRNFLKAPKTDFKYKHLPILRKLAQRCTNGGVEIFDARFGLIVPGDPRTYRLGEHWKLGMPLPEGTKLWLDPTDQDLPEINKDHLYISGKSQRSETRTLTRTLTLTGPSAMVPEGFLKGSERVPKGFKDGGGNNEGVADDEENGEGFSNGSGRVPEGFRNPSERVPEGFGKGFDIPGVGAFEDERGTDHRVRGSDRPVPLESGTAPRPDPNPPGDPPEPHDDFSPGGRHGGGGGSVVDFPVPAGARKPRYRHD